MFKKFVISVIAILTVFMFSTVAFAASGIITITRPDGDETTFKKTYMVCGYSDKEDVTVEVSVYDDKLGYYVPLYTVDGESSWTIGSSGMFMKEVKLPYAGANKMSVVSYKNSDPDNKQVNKFTITVLKESLKDKVYNVYFNIDNFLNSLGK